MMKRLFDIFFSIFGLLTLFPLFLSLYFIVLLTSKGGAFFRQIRVGEKGVHFGLLKFRSMKPASEKAGQLTVGSNDSRITTIGKIIRKYKLDELPQLLNILRGEMSFVGPRPEVPKYVEMYSTEQKRVLEVKPGLTDYASIKFLNENELLATQENPEAYYIEHIMPEKLKLNLQYIAEKSTFKDVHLILLTVKKIIT
jgi:lipopolysaccharide/colanic/teichoic acid biosynthesis glycosyltransferase